MVMNQNSKVEDRLPVPAAAVAPAENFEPATVPPLDPSDPVVDLRPARTPPPAAPAEGTGSEEAAEGTGAPSAAPATRPRMRRPVAAEGETLRVAHPTNLPNRFADPAEVDGENPYGENDIPGGPDPAPEQRFFENVDAAYASAMDGIADCAASLPPETTDTVYIEMTVGDDMDAPGNGVIRVDSISSAALTGSLEACARAVLTDTAVPPPYRAHTVEGAAYSVQSDTDAEYTLVFEMEMGATE